MPEPDTTPAATGLREQIRRALAGADGFDYDHLEPHDYQQHVDAVLAVRDQEMQALRAELAATVENLSRADEDGARTEDILRDMIDPDPCWYDHHGYCQAHGWFATNPACPHARAKALLTPPAPGGHDGEGQ